MFVDTHFHAFEMSKKELAVSALLAEAANKGLSMALDIGVLPEDWERRLELTSQFPWIIHSAGIYPGGSREPYEKELLPALRRILETGKAAAVGETGIDLHWDYAPAERQQELMKAQIDLANSFDLPVIIHNREADDEVLEVLRQYPPARGGIMHCFSSGLPEARRFIDEGMYISIAGNITYKKASSVVETASAVPLDRLLVETDAPYLAPHPVRGKPNHPVNIIHTYAFIARLRGMEKKHLMTKVKENFSTLFRL